jgi:hypothetical protein
MLILAAILVIWVAASLFAVALCAAARRGDRALVTRRFAGGDVGAADARRFNRAS